MGRVVALDGRGSGDITKTGEIWRADGLGIGFASPTVADGRVYVLDNAANLHALDEKTGRPLWHFNLGTIGRAAPTFADGKLYLTEQTGHVWIVKPGADAAEALDDELLTHARGPLRGDLGIGGGRLRAALLHRRGRPLLHGPEGRAVRGARERAPGPPETAPADARPAKLLVVPAEVIGSAGETTDFEAWAFDEKGRFIRKEKAAWSLDGLAGEISADGRLTTPAAATTAGKVKAAVGDLQASAQVRLFGPLPWTFDFEQGAVPRHWIGAGPRFKVTELDGGRRLHKPPVSSGLTRSTVFIGPPTMKGYTVEADLRATRAGPAHARHGHRQPGLHPRRDGPPPAAADPRLGRRAREVRRGAVRGRARRLVPGPPARGRRRREGHRAREGLEEGRAGARGVDDHPRGPDRGPGGLARASTATRRPTSTTTTSR